MGIECYGVSLLSHEIPIDYISERIERYPHVLSRGRSEDFGGEKYVYDDGQHLIEILLCENEGESSLDIRFALSNHSTIDAPFIELTKTMVDLTSAMIWPMNGTEAIRDSIPFPPGSDFFSIVESEIRIIRNQWLSMFDPPRGPVEVERAWDAINLKE